MDEILMFMGQRIHELRKKKGWQQDVLATAIGCSRTSICNLEAGRHWLSAEKLIKVCQVLNCQVGDLFPRVEGIEIHIEESTVEVVKVKKVRTVHLINSQSTNKP